MNLKTFRTLITFVVFISAVLMTIRSGSVKIPRGGGAQGIRDGNLPKATKAMEAMRWYNDQRAYPAGEIPEEWREKGISHAGLYNLSKPSGVSSISWSSVGPNNIGGRVRSIAIDPTNSNIIYCGSVSGGIWKSTTGGGNWIPLTDFAPNLVIGCIAINPVNPQIIYAGTGEGYFSIDALRGIGVLKSTDGGSSWSVLNNFTGSTAPYRYYFINKIVIRPDNPNLLFAAVSSTGEGIWKSTNGGASWGRDTEPGNLSKFCVDLVMDPNNPNIMYGAFGLFSADGIYKTTNGGYDWNKLTNGFPPTSSKYGRISLAVAPSNSSVVYAVLADSNYYTHSVQKSTNGGANWFAVATPYDNTIQVSGTHLGGQGWYNNVIAVHPSDEEIVYTGGINLFKSTNGGTSWSRISNGYGSPYVHVDQHAVAFDPSNSSVIYFGCDGGVFKSVNGGNSFSDLNPGFSTVQFYSGAVHPSQAVYYGGTQDNGTLKTGTIPSWSMTVGGDGGATWVDYNTPSTVYTEYVNLCIQKSTNSGGTWVKAMTGIPSGPTQFDGTTDRCDFIAPFVMDPSNPLNLVAGTYRVFRTTNGGSLWTAISGDLTGSGAGSIGGTISALAVSKSHPTTIYAGTSGSGTDSARILVTTDASNWANVTKSPLPNRYVKSIAIDPVFRDIAYAAYSGYNSSTPTAPGHVFRTVNRGASWSNASGNLPDIPVNTIVINPANTNHLIIGTDLGVFETFDGGTNWIQQNSGMANVSVADLDLNNGGYVFAATHGRGMFKSDSPVSVKEIPVSLPESYELLQNYPNPFNPSTRIKFGLDRPGLVTITVYDELGREVAVLADKSYFGYGAGELTFDGDHLSSGIYIYTILVEQPDGKGILFSAARKMALIK